MTGKNNTLKGLVSVSNSLDARGLVRLADRLDKIIFKIAEDSSAIVSGAIDRTVGMPHYENTFLTRNPGNESEGSVFLDPQTSESLKVASWEPYDHAEISAPAQGYKANIPGTFGIVNLSDLDPETPAKSVLGHKGEDPFAIVLVDKGDVPNELTNTDFTTILLGPGENGLIVWTFFPGPPVAPSRTVPSPEIEAIETVADAAALGFDYAKVATL